MTPMIVSGPLWLTDWRPSTGSGPHRFARQGKAPQSDPVLIHKSAFYRSNTCVQFADRVWAKASRRKGNQQQNVQRNLRRFGVVLPVIMDARKGIVSGHAVVKAAIEFGLTEIPTVRLDDLSDAELRALRISLHNIEDLAESTETFSKPNCRSLPISKSSC